MDNETPQTSSTGRRLLLIVAVVAQNGVIGARAKLPWRLSSDLRRFKALTLGKPLVMGRKTFQSIGRPLPGRETIVVTRDPGFSAGGVHLAHDLDAALALAEARAVAMDADAVVIAGGGELYAQTFALADRLAITEVALAPEGDAVFPPIDPAEWREVRREPGIRGPNDEADFAFVDYVRAGGSGRIQRLASVRRSPSCASPPPASRCENDPIPQDLLGQAL